MKAQHDLITNVALYLQVNVYTLFHQASALHLGFEDDKVARAEYELFITHGYVPKHVIEYCELIVCSME